MAEISGADGYQIGALLGRGSMGTVYRAREIATGREVALKVLLTADSEAIYRLKREFRSLASVDHPNLVALDDLVVTDDRCFFTMDLIDGVSFVDYVRGASDPLTRLPAALEQLVRGVQALHDLGKLHRDLKPPNVLVEPSGRVVILDFGLVSSVGSEYSRQSQRGALVGTLAYMAPEQAWGEPLSSAADLYSIGVMVYESLTGVLPFSGPVLRQLFEKREADLEPPSRLAPSVPKALDDLVARLLRPTPADRPTADEILGALSALGRASPPARPAQSKAPATPFVGRSAELLALREVFSECARGELVAICVEGSSGIGKTTLVERFLATLGSAAPIVLRARCHPHENVQFKAIDGLVDDLARYLDHEARDLAEAVLPRNVAALVRVFPVLTRAPAVAAASQQGAPGAEPAETRRRAFRSLLEMFGRISDRAPLVLWIDDLQWGDRDSAALLGTLCDLMYEARVLLILSFRSEEREVVSQLGFNLDGARVRTLELGPLEPAETEALLQILLSDHPGLGAERVEELALESRGNPFFAAQLARHVLENPTPDSSAPPRLARVVEARIDELPADARRLLEVIAAAGRPVAERVALRTLNSPLEGRAAIRALRSRWLVREAGGASGGALLPFHDRIREAIVARLSPEALAGIHRRLAEALEELPDADPAVLVHHYLNAGDEPRAARLAFEAAERAASGLAFNRAAALYRLVLELPTRMHDEGLLNVRLGESLVSAGRGAEGGRCLAKAADLLAEGSSDLEPALDIRRRAAEELLRSGVYSEGLRVLREVLDATGLWYPPSTRLALASLVASRLGLGRFLRPLRGTETRATPQQRLTACWSAGHGLSLFDMIRAAEFHVRHGDLAAQLGDAKHIALAVASDSLITAMEGGRRNADRSTALAAEAERLSREVGDPNVEAYRLVTEAVTAFAQWRFRDSIAICDRGVALCRDRCTGAAWERANLQACAAMCLANLGDYTELWQRLPEWLREADEHSDLYLVLMLRLGYSNAAWLALDRPDEARRQIDYALKDPFPDTFTWQIHLGLFSRAQLALYEGDARTAQRLVDEAWPAVRSSGILRHQYLRAQNLELRARCAIALAAEPGCGETERDRLLKSALADARRLSSEAAGATGASALAIRAAAARIRGSRDEADRLLLQAIGGFERSGMGAHVAAGRFHLASLLAEPGSSEDRERAREWMQRKGIRNPDRFSAMLMPGLAGPR